MDGALDGRDGLLKVAADRFDVLIVDRILLGLNRLSSVKCWH